MDYDYFWYCFWTGPIGIGIFLVFIGVLTYLDANAKAIKIK